MTIAHDSTGQEFGQDAEIYLHSIMSGPQLGWLKGTGVLELKAT